MIKDLVTVVDSADKCEPFLERLAAACTRIPAHLEVTVLTAAPVLIPLLAPFGGVYVPEFELRETSGKAMAQTRASLSAAGAPDAQVTGISGDMAWLPGDLKNRIPVTDLIVLPPEPEWAVGWLRRRVAETLLVSSGTPLILLPPDGDLPLCRHAVLGWLPSPEARRAMHDLAAYAAPGATIEVVSVRSLEDDPVYDHDKVVEHLRRRGFDASSVRLDQPGPEDVTLQQYAARQGADLLAVGGYAHSRLREIILGGVTRSLVRGVELPVLMSH